MVITDHLTGLYSRNYLDEQLNLSLQRDSCGSLILIDIDYFKRINDTYGHQTGDQVLRQVAQILKENTRDEDISARWGGEELTVYLPTVELEKGLEIAERIRTCVETQTDPQVTISIGVTSWTNDQGPALKVEKLFHQADMALYRAKNNGRNQCVTG